MEEIVPQCRHAAGHAPSTSVDQFTCGYPSGFCEVVIEARDLGQLVAAERSVGYESSTISPSPKKGMVQ